MVERTPDALWAEIPSHLRGGIARWFIHKIPPGGFLTLVISDRLHEAACRADEQSLDALGYIGLFFALYPNIEELNRYPEFLRKLEEACDD